MKMRLNDHEDEVECREITKRVGACFDCFFVSGNDTTRRHSIIRVIEFVQGGCTVNALQKCTERSSELV